MQETDELPWACPWRGWRARFDDPAAPWWGWRSIEKFWVDANFLHGAIPAFVAEKWPALRTLDLYDNDLGGTIPPELARLTGLHQLLLHDNRLTGTVPQALLALPKMQLLQFSVNPELGGCTSEEQLRANPRSVLGLWPHHTAFRITETAAECAAHLGAWVAPPPHDYDGELRAAMHAPLTAEEEAAEDAAGRAGPTKEQHGAEEDEEDEEGELREDEELREEL